MQCLTNMALIDQKIAAAEDRKGSMDIPMFRKELNVMGAKDDSDKVDTTLITQDMPRALLEIARVGMFGMSKGYPRGGWIEVPDGIRRYTAAQFRHDLKPAMGEEKDPESNLSHLAHSAWNAMAKLELYLREQEKKRF